MPEEEKSDVASEAKSVSASFIQSLGLVELILGGVGLYWLRLWYREQVPGLFPTTGLSFVDAGLLAFAAALVGKLLCLLVNTMMAVVRLVAEKYRVLYYKRIEAAVCSYSDVADLAALLAKLKQEKIDLIELGSYYLVLEDPNQRAHFELIRTRAIVAHSTALLALPYAFYFVREGAPTSMILLGLAGSLLFLVLGFLEQLDYLRSLAERLVAVRTARKKEADAQPSHTASKT